MLEDFPFDTAPRYLLRDRDRIYGESVNLALMTFSGRTIQSIFQPYEFQRVLGFRQGHAESSPKDLHPPDATEEELAAAVNASTFALTSPSIPRSVRR